MKQTFKSLMSILLAIIIISGIMPLSFTQVFAEELKPDVWDGTKHDIVTPEGDVYKIDSAKDLAWFAEQVNAGNTFSGKTISLTRDINLNNLQWTPIGKNLTCAFSGTFLGNGHSIYCLKVSYSTDSANIINAPHHAVGFFGVCINASVKELNLFASSVEIKNESGYQNSASSIEGTSVFAGELCGYAVNSEFKAIYSTDSVVSAYTGGEAGECVAGGIIGLMKDGSEAAYCFKYYGSVSGESQSLSQNASAGGVVGKIVNEGTVRQCCNYGDVAGGHIMAAAYTGGVVGSSTNSSSALSVIKDSFNRGQVSHTGSWLDTGALGGIIGGSYSSVIRCYNSGNVVAASNTVGGNLYASGISGETRSNAIVSDCATISSTISGGTSNYIISASGNKENNVSKSSISGQPINDSNRTYNQSAFYSSSLFTSELGWDFSEIWQSSSDDYPTLRKMTSSAEEIISKVNSSIEQLTIIFAEGDTYDKVTQDVMLVKTFNDFEVSWKSSNENIVNSETGVVNRVESDVQVKLTAVISSPKYECVKIFYLCVIGKNHQDDLDSESWAMSVDSARELIAMVRGCKFKDVKADDSAVKVLTGKDDNEENIKNTMADIISFWEVPVDNAYLRKKMGDVIGLIKTGQDKAIKDIVGSLSDGLVDYEPDKDEPEDENQNGEFNVSGKGITKRLIAIPNAMLDIKINAVDAYSKMKSLGNISFNTKDDILIQAYNNSAKVGSFVDYVVNTASSSSGGPTNPSRLGAIFTNISNIIEAWNLYGAWNDAKQNAVKAYFQAYMNNRKHYSSPNDEEFKLLMSAHICTSIKTDIENISSIAEALYALESKFCSGLDENYKITVACPVDVEIYDQYGILVGRVKNNIIDHSIYNSLKIELAGENNDQKIIYFEDDEKYSVRITGNNTGIMNVSVGETKYNFSDYYYYNDIALEDGKDMILDISLSDIQNSNLSPINTLLDGTTYFASETKEINSNEKKYLFKAYECIEKSGETQIIETGGTIECGLLSEGTVLNELIEPKYGYSFEGFYLDSLCTTPFDELIMPAEDVLVYAKFIKNSNNISIITQPESASYISDDIATALNVEYKTAEGYTVELQWFKKNLETLETERIDGANDSSYVPLTNIPGLFAYYLEIKLLDDEGEVYATSKTNYAVISVGEARLIDNGYCGDNILWSFYESKKLKLTGYGNMAGFESSDDVPWAQYAPEIERVVFDGDIESISDYAFYGCVNLTSLFVPDSIKSIGENALAECVNLKTLSVPFVGSNRNANNSYDSVFGYIFGRSDEGVDQYNREDGNNLYYHTYAIPESLEVVSVTDAAIIPFGAFHNCSNLKKIEINNGVAEIGAYSFASCSGLTDFVVPDTVEYIAERAFNGCNALVSITLPFVGASRTANNTYDAVFGYIFGRCSASTGVVQYVQSDGESVSYYNYDIPQSIRTVIVTDSEFIPFGSFHNCSKISSIKINDVKNIYSYAFANCSAITEFKVPNSVINIYEDAFNGCNSIEKISLPFIGSSREANGTYDAVLGYIFGRSNSGTLQYGVVDGGSIYGYYYAVPGSLNSVEVTDATQIAVGAFSNCSNIAYLSIEGSVTKFSDYSLMNCTGLEELHIPPSFETLTSDDLSGCSYLKKLYVYSRNCTVSSTMESIPIGSTIYAYRNSTAHKYSERYNRNFVPLDVSISGLDSTGIIVDSVNMLIYGFGIGCKDVMSNLLVSGAGSAMASTTGTISTGVTVTLKDITSAVTDVYTVVIFGDIDGNGWYDANDAFLVNMLASGLISADRLSSAQLKAADCNHDGAVDSADFYLLNQASLMLEDVDQSATKEQMVTNAMYISYCSLIDQTARVETNLVPVPETTTESAADDIYETTPDTAPEANKEFDVEVIFITIFEFTKKILTLVFSFMIW